MSQDGYKLSREVRSWVPRWLWRIAATGPYAWRLGGLWPFKQILTRKVGDD